MMYQDDDRKMFVSEIELHHAKRLMPIVTSQQVLNEQRQSSFNSVECAKIDKFCQGSVGQHISTSAHLFLHFFQRTGVFCHSFVPACCAHACLTVLVTFSAFGSRNRTLHVHHAHLLEKKTNIQCFSLTLYSTQYANLDGVPGVLIEDSCSCLSTPALHNLPLLRSAPSRHPLFPQPTFPY